MASPEFDTAEPQKAGFPELCPVVRIGHGPRLPGRFKRPRVATCPDVAPEIIEPIAASLYLPTLLDRTVAAARSVVDQWGLAGMVLLWTFDSDGGERKKEFIVPPPFQVLFEPRELNEADPELRALCDESPSRSGYRRVRPSVYAQWSRAAILPLCIVVLAICVMFCFASTRDIGSLIPAIVFLLAVAGLVPAAYRISRRRWLIVPGGVIVRYFWLRAWRPRTCVFRPSDTILVLKHAPPGWLAELWRERGMFESALTDLEAMALLSAWRSSVPVPDVETET